MIQAGRLGASTPIVSSEILLSAAAAVLLGGTSFAGGVTGNGRRRPLHGTLQNGFAIRGVSSFWQQLVTGVILVLAVGIDRIQELRGRHS